MNPYGSLPWSHERTTGFCPEPDESILHSPPALFFFFIFFVVFSLYFEKDVALYPCFIALIIPKLYDPVLLESLGYWDLFYSLKLNVISITKL
jgi:hypothetical protein